MGHTDFERELEFVQLLCSPDYLRWLGQEGHIGSEHFRDCLRRLEYWKQPEYSRFLTYPQCLVVLDHLNSDAGVDEAFLTKLGEQQHFIWLNRHREDWKL